ncbi:hypothetical protein THAOC_29162, partial [Thalassiosira oceanica]
MRLVHQEPKASWNNSNSPRELSDPALTNSPSSILQGDERASDEATPLTTEAATGDGRAGGRAVRRRWRPKANGARGEGRHGHFCPRSPNDAEGAEGPGKDGASPSGRGGRKATCPAPPLPGNGTALLRPGTVRVPPTPPVDPTGSREPKEVIFGSFSADLPAAVVRGGNDVQERVRERRRRKRSSGATTGGRRRLDRAGRGAQKGHWHGNGGRRLKDPCGAVTGARAWIELTGRLAFSRFGVRNCAALPSAPVAVEARPRPWPGGRIEARGKIGRRRREES